MLDMLVTNLLIYFFGEKRFCVFLKRLCSAHNSFDPQKVGLHYSESISNLQEVSLRHSVSVSEPQKVGLQNLKEVYDHQKVGLHHSE